MTDENGVLTDDDKRSVDEWIKSHHPNGMKCPMCQAMDWTLSNQMAGLIPVNKVGTVTVGGMFRLIGLTCRQCAFVLSLNAQAVDIF